ncbi:MAG: TonB-dependent receptor [Bacteroidota bacterium]
MPTRLLACTAAGFTLLLSLLVLRPTPVHAQQPAFTGTMPDSIVVTASRLPDLARLTGRRVQVWNAAEIQALPASSFDEVLRTVGGLEVQSRGGFGVQSDLTMRGSTFNGVLVLLDGQPLNDPMTGHFLTDFPVPLSDIARIEVLRGPAASLYGPDALGGVIQLFTYAGLPDATDAAAGLDVDALVRLGEHQLSEVEAAIRTRAEGRLLSVAVGTSGTDGEAITTPDGAAVRNAEGDRLRTDFQRVVGSIALAQELGSASLYARVGVDDRDFGAFQYYTGFSSDRAREATTTLWFQSRLTGSLSENTRWQIGVSAKQHDDTYVFNQTVPANEHTSRLAALQARLTRSFSPQVRLTAGVSGALRGIESNRMGTRQDGVTGAFVTLRWQATPQWTLNASSRADYDPSYGTELTPQLNVAYNTGPLTLRGGAGRAVRAPNYVERYLDGGGNVGNPALDAERAWSGEVGADLYSGPVSLHATAFVRRTDNLIDYALIPGDDAFRARNILEVNTRGLEVDLDGFQPLGYGTRLRWTTSYTYLDADLTETTDGAEFKYALTSARHLLQGTATLEAGAFALGVQALWKDRRFDNEYGADDYGVVHARLAYQVLRTRYRLSLSGEVRNLFDATYAEIFRAPMPGRWFVVGLRLQR